jgi:hypothetical protein
MVRMKFVETTKLDYSFGWVPDFEERTRTPAA